MCVCVCVCVCATTHVEVGDAISEIVIVFEEGQSFRKRVQTTAHLALLFVSLFLLALLFLFELHRCVKKVCHANIEADSLWVPFPQKYRNARAARDVCALALAGGERNRDSADELVLDGRQHSF